MKRDHVAAAGLLTLGLLQMAGVVLGLPNLTELGAATAASPAPTVFSTHGGLETFSPRFFIEFTDTSGRQRSIELNRTRYARIRGPYNRRNAYGAALAYGPFLAADPRTEPMFRAVFHHAVCGDAPLLRELGLDPAAVKGALRIRLEPLPQAGPADLPRVIEARCP